MAPLAPAEGGAVRKLILITALCLVVAPAAAKDGNWRHCDTNTWLVQLADLTGQKWLSVEGQYCGAPALGDPDHTFDVKVTHAPPPHEPPPHECPYEK